MKPLKTEERRIIKTILQKKEERRTIKPKLLLQKKEERRTIKTFEERRTTKILLQKKEAVSYTHLHRLQITVANITLFCV